MSSSGTKKKTRKRQPLPKPPARPRLAVNAPPLRDAEGMASLGDKLVTAAEGHTGMFVNPPNIPPLKTAIGLLRPAIVAADGGSDAQQSALLTATTKVHGQIVLHAAWVQAGANALPPVDAATFITTAGFPLMKKGQRANRTAPELTNKGPAVVHFDLPTLPGAMMWFSEVSLDGGKTYTRAVDTEHIKGDITGLPSGQLVWIRLRAYVRGSGYTPWTILSIIVT